MSARPDDNGDAVLRPLTTIALNEVMQIEIAVYPFPWTRGNFIDSIAAGHLTWTLHGSGGVLLGYCVAMPGFAEMHLLNITVVPWARRCGHARRMLEALADACRQAGATRLWLEVRTSNAEARATYVRLGFETVGVRNGYYPAAAGQREDALVMSRPVPADRHALD